MALEYNSSFKNRFMKWSNFYSGFFIDPRHSEIVRADMLKVDHDMDTLIRVFNEFYNPVPFYAYCDKDDVIEDLENRIKNITSKGYNDISKEQYICLKLYRYFLTAYKSKNTKMWKNGKDVVELKETTGYNPIFEYDEYSEWNFFDWDGYAQRFMAHNDILEILKSILVQACDIDSLESSLPNTILTSKSNIYDTFYNYLLMDFNIQVIPKKVYDPVSEKFIDYKQNEFLISDNEIRLKEEIGSIKRLVKPEDRYKYFR